MKRKKDIKQSEVKSLNGFSDDELKNLYKKERWMTIAIYTLIVITTLSIALIAYVLLTNQ